MKNCTNTTAQSITCENLTVQNVTATTIRCDAARVTITNCRNLKMDVSSKCKKIVLGGSSNVDVVRSGDDLVTQCSNVYLERVTCKNLIINNTRNLAIASRVDGLPCMTRSMNSKMWIASKNGVVVRQSSAVEIITVCEKFSGWCNKLPGRGRGFTFR